MRVLPFVVALALLSIHASGNTVYTGLDALISPNDTAFLLIDHQPFQFSDLHSHEPLLIQHNLLALADAAKVFNIPVVITTVLQDRGGYFFKGVLDLFPEVTVIDRTTINAWEDPNVVNAIAAFGKKKLVIAALWTEVCLALPVIHAMADGYEVYFVTDASGGKSKESHDMGVQRMIQAGAVPMTTNVVIFELQRDWARDTQVGVLDIMVKHLGGSGIALLWEMQLLNSCESGEPTAEPLPSSSTGTEGGETGLTGTGGIP